MAGEYVRPATTPEIDTPVRAGVICNPKSHQNKIGDVSRSFASSSVAVATPRTREALKQVLADFARDGIDLLVIDGGDGTIRDVLTCAATIWSTKWPRIAVVPSGKTNALALDLGIPLDWSIERALAAASENRVAVRCPLEITRDGGAGTLLGFLLGTGAFVAATALAQRTHRVGAFNGVAVTLALGWALTQTLFGSASGPWRSGEHVRLRARRREGAADLTIDDRRYLLLVSTLERLPVGLKPFGRTRGGMKLLAIDAPPRLLVGAVPALLTGSEAGWLDRLGYRRFDVETLDLTLDHDFILDGEIYHGGALTIRHAEPLRFVVP